MPGVPPLFIADRALGMGVIAKPLSRLRGLVAFIVQLADLIGPDLPPKPPLSVADRAPRMGIFGQGASRLGGDVALVFLAVRVAGGPFYWLSLSFLHLSSSLARIATVGNWVPDLGGCNAVSLIAPVALVSSPTDNLPRSITREPAAAGNDDRSCKGFLPSQNERIGRRPLFGEDGRLDERAARQVGGCGGTAAQDAACSLGLGDVHVVQDLAIVQHRGHRADIDVRAFAACSIAFEVGDRNLAALSLFLIPDGLTFV